MSKELKLTIYGTCQECPYCQHNPDYNRSYDSGYDCKHPDSKVNRIVDDHNLYNYQNPQYTGWPEIPAECPLPNAKEE